MKVGIPSLMAFAIGSMALATAACAGSPARDADDTQIENEIQASCTATTAPSCPVSSPHYANVAPIFQKNCVPCHPGSGAATQWPLTAYDDIAPWAGEIEDEVCENAMPPADGGIAMDPSDRLTILHWVTCGAPE